MHSSKKNGKSLDDFTTIALADCSSPHCYFNRRRQWQSVSEMGDDVLNISPRLNHYNPGIRPERRLHGYNSLCYSESASEHNINSSISSNETQVSKLTLWGLFSPAIKLITGNFKHPYALAYPEPLVHFALCLGAYSDPAVRVYTGNGKGINRQLQLAKMEFIQGFQANVSVPKKTRILLPTILHYYAKGASLDLPDLIKTVSECMPESIQDTIRGSKLKKCVEWSEYNSTFRYLLHRDLARQ